MSDRTRDPKDGVLEAVSGRWRLRFVRRLAHAPETVWRALTEERHLAAWFPTTIEGELRAGAPLRFAFREGAIPPTVGELIACDPPSLLEFTWRFPEGTGSGSGAGSADAGAEGSETVRIELEPEGTGCVLTFVTTYDQVGKSARDAAGWHVCFDLLELELKGQKPSWQPAERWKPLNARYAERFGPDASTIGPPEERADHR